MQTVRCRYLQNKVTNAGSMREREMVGDEELRA